MSPTFLYARGARQGSVEGPNMWNQVLDNALREPGGRWESEGIGFRLATDHCKAQKRRRGSSGEAVKDEGRVLHHLCWADDLHAIAGTMLGHSRSTNLEMLLRTSATVAKAGFGECWRAWRHWARGWTIEAARKPACGTESPKPTPCSTRRSPNCRSRGVLTPSTRRVHQRRSMVLVNGPIRSQCSRHCVFGNWGSFVESCACEGDQASAGPTT